MSTSLSPASAQILEWSTTVLLDRDAEILSRERADFQQRTTAMLAAWQPVPPLMILGFASRLSQWIEYFGKYESDAERLAAVGRPAVRQRLNTMIGELRKEVPIYQQTVGQGPAAPAPAASDTEAARKLRETRAETERIERDTRAATAAAGAQRQDMYSNVLMGRCPNCGGTGKKDHAICRRCYGSGRF